MKKIISLILVFLLIFSFAFTLSSCGGEENPENGGGENEGGENENGDDETPGTETQFPIIPLEPV